VSRATAPWRGAVRDGTDATGHYAVAPVSLVDESAPVPVDARQAPQRERPLLRGWLHAGALAVAVVAGPILAAHARDAGDALALSVYALALVALFGVSAAFHRVRWKETGRRRMRRADHATIFFAIAGTYTAVAGLVLHGWAQVLVLCLVWVGGAVGVTVRQAWMDVPKWAVAVPYVVVGWCALAVMPQLWRGLGGAGFGLVVAGGACYTAGALCYALRRPDPAPGVFGYHEIFHSFTVIGATLHFVAVAAYALPRS
jgi:hemolysin III